MQVSPLTSKISNILPQIQPCSTKWDTVDSKKDTSESIPSCYPQDVAYSRSSANGTHLAITLIMKKKSQYSIEPRADILAVIAQYEGMTRAQLHVARHDAIERQDWLAMQAITYVMSLAFDKAKE